MKRLLVLLLLSHSAIAQVTIPAGTGDQMLSGMIGMMGKMAQQLQDSQMGSLAGHMGSSKLPMETMVNPGLASAAGPTTTYAGDLNGAWRSSGGEYLLIEGERFRLHSGSQRYIDGRLARRGNVVGFLYPKQRTALLYRYQIRGDRLALLSREGRMMGFQRVPLNR